MTNFESFDSLMARQPLPVREAVERRFQELRDSLSPPALDAPVAAPFDEAAALEHFSDYFRRNYPGPDTIIGRPDWHSPKIFRAALHAIKANASPVAAQAVTDGPHWTHNKPDSSGVYGVRGFDVGVDPEDQYEAVVSVREYEGELICNLHERTSDSEFQDWSRVSDMSDRFEWCKFDFAHPNAAPCDAQGANHAD